jgi:hypothetical protein
MGQSVSTTSTSLPSSTTVLSSNNTSETKSVSESKVDSQGCKPTATAGFSGDPSSWYTILTPSFPDTVPMSLNRNRGFAEGPVVLESDGITVQESGNYWVSVTAYLSNPSETTGNIFPVFLVRDGTFDFKAEDLLGVTLALRPVPSGDTFFDSATASGPLRNVRSGTRLSLVINNGGAPDPQPVSVVAWNISLHKL